MRANNLRYSETMERLRARTTIPASGFGFAGALRREIIARNRRMAEEHNLEAVCSDRAEGVVVYAVGEDGVTHGNFFAESYRAIVGRPDWQKRLGKVHTGRRNLPNLARWHELDACTSSDALLMNIFCNPRVLSQGKLHRLMNVDAESQPEFGVRVAAPLRNGHRDRTEVDMRMGDLLVEGKLTEADFQCCRAELVERYLGFHEVFDGDMLPRLNGNYAGYQLLRNVLAAFANKERICVIADARRPDLREQWFGVMRCIRSYEVRLRCQMLTWQEICAELPLDLQGWLGEKYGIFAPMLRGTPD